MRLALDDAGLSPSDIVHINAHGTSTPLNDAAEAAAMAAVFGSTRPAVTSTKGVTGHALGAAGALEAAAVLLSFANKLIPPQPAPRHSTPNSTSTSSSVRRVRGHRDQPCRTTSASVDTTVQ